jgi:hypothetical protein
MQRFVQNENIEKYREVTEADPLRDEVRYHFAVATACRGRSEAAG